MTKSKLKWFWKNYSIKMIRLDQFALASLGLIQSQTILKIENYLIVCAPYQLSMRKAVLFVVLNKEEIPFFTRYIGKLAALKLTFQKSLNGIPLKFFVWVTIKQIAPIKGKENMCLIEVDYKNCPESLISVIGDHITKLQTLDEFYRRYKDKLIPIDHNTSQVLQYNNYLECFMGNRKIEAKLLSIAVNQLHILLPGSDPNIKEGFEFKLKLYFKLYRFFVKGKIEKFEKTMNGYSKLNITIQYSPEITDIINTYFSRLLTQLV